MKRTLVWSLAVGVALAAGFLALAGAPFRGGPAVIQTTRTTMMELRRAVEVWRAAHPGCPSLDDLRAARVVDPAWTLTDKWGTPFEIVCTDEETTIVSRGPDTVPSGDDVFIPAGYADAGAPP